MKYSNNGSKSTTEALTRIPILVVAPQPFYEDRGTPIALRYTLKALTDQGYRVHLLTYPVGQNIAMPGLRIIRIPNFFRIKYVPIGLSFRKILLDVILFFSLFRLLRHERYCCVHAVEEAAFPAVVLAKAYALPVIYDMQSSLPEQLEQFKIFQSDFSRNVLRFFERWLIRKTDIIICSAGLKEYVRRINPSVITKEWYFPVNLHDKISQNEKESLRRTLGIPAEAPVVLYCGTFERYQGIDCLLKVTQLVVDKEPNTVFVLVGAGNSKHFTLSKKLKKLRESGALKLFPRQPKSSIPVFLATADIVISARHSGANLPLKIFEYMASGKAIVATDIPAHRTVLDHKRAFLVGADMNEISNAIIKLVRDRKQAESIGAAARAYAEENFSWESFVEIVKKSYKNVIGGTDTYA